MKVGNYLIIYFVGKPKSMAVFIPCFAPISAARLRGLHPGDIDSSREL